MNDREMTIANNEAQIPDTLFLNVNDTIPDTVVYNLQKDLLVLQVGDVFPDRDYRLTLCIKNESVDSLNF